MALVYMLAFHPRAANAASLQTQLDVVWSPTGIVTLSQLGAFLAFQICPAGARAPWPRTGVS